MAEQMTKNTQYANLFDTDAKAEAFDKIAVRFYDGNFGQMSKGDFETLMFHLYIERCLKKSLPFDDYTLSRAFGITQSRIRTLKVKKELQYPHTGFEWKKAFISYVKSAKYDKDKRLVKMSIPDVNVLIELRNYLETQGWYDEYQLNPKLFQCRLDIFLELCQSLDQETPDSLPEDAQKNLKELEKKMDDEQQKHSLEKILSGKKENVIEGIKEIALKSSEAIIIEMLKSIPFLGGISSALIKAISHSLHEK